MLAQIDRTDEAKRNFVVEKRNFAIEMKFASKVTNAL